MRLSITALLDYNLPEPADLLFALEVAQTLDQRLIEDLLSVGGTGALRPIAADDGLGRRTWARGEGRVTARYTATVEIERPATVLRGLDADDVKTLPAGVVPYLFPSRYCEADRLDTMVRRGRTLSELASVMQAVPQVLRSVAVSDPAILNGDAAFWSRVRDVDEELGETGRVLVRPSGTEPKVRVMVECLDAEAAEDACTRLVELVEHAARVHGA